MIFGSLPVLRSVPFLLGLNTGHFRASSRLEPHRKETGPGEQTTCYGQRTPRATRPQTQSDSHQQATTRKTRLERFTLEVQSGNLFHCKRLRLGFWNQGVHVLDSVPFWSTRNLDQACHLRPDTPPTARHGESWNVMPAVWSWQAGDEYVDAPNQEL